MIILNPDLDIGHFILSGFKKEGFIIAMKFDYLGLDKCHSILSAFVNKEAENCVNMLVMGVDMIY